MQYLQSMHGMLWLSIIRSATLSKNSRPSPSKGTSGENIRKLSCKCSFAVSQFGVQVLRIGIVTHGILPIGII